MISFEEALRLLDEHVKPGATVEAPLLESLGLTLARPIAARADSPRFDASAVDGYAVSRSDFSNGLPVVLSIAGTIHAGAASVKSLKPGSKHRPRCTHRIFTGAPVPKGADAIVMQENVAVADNKVTFTTVPTSGAYIRKRGAEFQRGEHLFEPGTILTPAVAQSLAACGFARVYIHARPSVSIIITGDELRPPGTKLHSGEIWDSNATALEAALHALGITNVHTQHVSDNARSTTRAIRSALERSDVIIATGGVSVGERDYVKEAFAANGVREIFWRVRMRPGMPLYFGVKLENGRTKYIFGLPGNPVSVMVTFQLFARRAVRCLMGHAAEEAHEKGVLAAPLKKSVARMEFVRAYRERTSGPLSTVVPLAARESNMTTGMARADALIVFPEEQEFLAEGSEVEIIPIQWGPY
ncbi:MAG TPA: gephyrin-like molybdotransferase Glp [Candidatus Kapabacteria bacterium]|nr:gephyrin-like molybdotransferase Glp [Candidatus Kapabacteria bacterium]